MTQFYFTVNPRNLMHFLSLRNDKHALKEIRDVAVEIEKIFAVTMPLTYQAYINNRPVDNDELTSLSNQVKSMETTINTLKKQNEELIVALSDARREVDSMKTEHHQEFIDSKPFDVNVFLSSMTDRDRLLKAIEKVVKELNTIKGKERR